MKPALPKNRSRPQLHAGFPVHATEPTASKNYKWTSKTFPDINLRMMTDSQSEYELPNAGQNEQTDFGYEYVTSSSLEDLRQMKIYPAKPMNMQSVYADKQCLPVMPPPLCPKGGLSPWQRSQAVLKQQSLVNIQPSTQYRSNNIRRDKKSSDSHAGSVAQGPAVDRTVKPFTAVKVPFQTSAGQASSMESETEGHSLDFYRGARFEATGPVAGGGFERSPILDHKQPALPPPRLRRSKQNEAIIPRNGADFRSPDDIIPPVRQQHSLPFRPISKSLPQASSLHQTTQMPVKLLQDLSRRPKPQSSPDRQKRKHFPRPAAKDLEGNIWYIGACDRSKAEEALRTNNKNGAFLVRDSSKGIPDKPYVLVVYYRCKVYSIQIRYLEDSNQYALGSGLRGHDMFDSVSDMIEIHRNIPLRLIDRRDQSGSQMEQCTLTVPVTQL
ncbi:lymphocyte cytosolic protein 2 isoform X5 [Heterodontus francisci]|uniref:lymphocyte cytosolic protein 2 isoform X5 n=1 Tax=Heterodontus francisci TaxID=7792 RepID=UPI00355C6958